MLRPALAATLLAALAAASAHAAGDPSVRLARVHPLEVRGAGFAANEHVRVTVRAGGSRGSAEARSGAGGRFTVTLPHVTVGHCSSLVVVATGARGDRARLVRRAPECPPD